MKIHKLAIFSSAGSLLTGIISFGLQPHFPIWNFIIGIIIMICVMGVIDKNPKNFLTMKEFNFYLTKILFFSGGTMMTIGGIFIFNQIHQMVLFSIGGYCMSIIVLCYTEVQKSKRKTK